MRKGKKSTIARFFEYLLGFYQKTKQYVYNFSVAKIQTHYLKMDTDQNKVKKEREKKHINKKIREIEYETSNQSFEPDREAISSINKIFESRENFKKEYLTPT